jgi:soluble lytic murein transglycosylase-like protein
MARTRSWQLGATALVLSLTAGCGFFGDSGSGEPGAAQPVAEVAAESSSPSPEPVSPSPEVTTVSPSPKAKKKKKATTAPTPTEDPNNFTEPDCADHEGKNVSKAKAKSALLAAAGRTYWPGSAPKLKVPSRLVIATAWHESGWQSNIVNCDGGRGLMQVMPDTETFINGRFEKSYDSRDYRQNATLGANYLAWLTRYLGDTYFKGSYDLSAKKCKTHKSMCLLNMVIAGYNAGSGTVEEAYADKRLPNPEYVNSVRHLMKSCFCDKY